MSAFDLKFNVSAEGLADALKIAIDSVAQVKKREENPTVYETEQMKSIQKRHEDLLHQTKESEAATSSLLRSFLDTLAEAGENINNDNYRYQLREYIRFWSNIIDEKEGRLPIIQLHPFVGVKSLELESPEEASLIERREIELQSARLEVEKQRINYAVEIASKMIDALSPKADEQTKTILIKILLPNLLALSEGKGLELALPTSKSDEAVPQ